MKNPEYLMEVVLEYENMKMGLEQIDNSRNLSYNTYVFTIGLCVGILLGIIVGFKI